MSIDYKHRLTKYEKKIINLEESLKKKKGNNELYFTELKKIYPSCMHDSGCIKSYEKDVKGNKVITTYGEMNYEGLEKLYGELKKDFTFDSFIDIGSGRGKLVLYMAGFPEIAKSYGVEIVDERASYADEMKSKLEKYDFINKVEFFNKSMFEINYKDLFKSKKTPLIWISNLCFDSEITAKLIDQLVEQMPKGTIISCSKIMNQDKLTHIKDMKIPMSWSSDSNVHIYQI